MKLSHLPATVALSLGFFAFAFDGVAQEIQTGYQPDSPLSELKTFRFFNQQRTAPDGLADDPVTEEQLRTLLIDNLTSIGLEPASEAPDFFIAFYAKAHLRTKFKALGYSAYGPIAGLTPETYEVGTLIVDFVSSDGKQAVWRGMATKRLKAENLDRDLRKICQKLIQQFQRDAKKQAKRK